MLSATPQLVNDQSLTARLVSSDTARVATGHMIKLVKSSFYREEETKRKLAAFVARSDWFSMGRECETFERGFADVQGRRHCVLVNSGSSANLALVQALLNLGRLCPGDSVGFSAVSWSTNVMPLLQLGLRPVPIDVELDTLNVSSRTLERVLKETPLRAVFLTDLLGWCDDIERIRAICQERSMLLLEDSCEALGTVYRGTRLGNFGLASTFSFYVGHHLSTIEGGAICADDHELANMLRVVRAHGWDRNLDRETQTALREKHLVASTFYSRYAFYDRGFNLRPTEITGFLGNLQLPYLSEVVARRQDNFYRLALPIYARADFFFPLRSDHLAVFSNFAVPVVCRSAALRDALVSRCEGHIEIRPIVGGDMTQQPFFRRYADGVVERFPVPNARLVHSHGLYVGNNPELSGEEMAEIIRTFTDRALAAVVPAEVVAARLPS